MTRVFFFLFSGVHTFAHAAGFVAQLFSDARSNATIQRNALHVEFHVEKTNTGRSIQTSDRSEYNGLYANNNRIIVSVGRVKNARKIGETAHARTAITFRRCPRDRVLVHVIKKRVYLRRFR